MSDSYDDYIDRMDGTVVLGFGTPYDDEWEECALCGDEHPVGVLDDGLCPSCVDESPPAPETKE